MTAIEIYTRPGCGYCTAAKSLLTRKNAAFTELNVATDPAYREQMYDRAGARLDLSADLHRHDPCRRLRRALRARSRGQARRHAGGRKGLLMSAGSTFTAAMVQMRTGLLPEPSLEQGTKLIREAAAQGADYVLTPEVSNMMQLNRKALFEHLARRGRRSLAEGLSRARRGIEDPSPYRLAGAALFAGARRQPLVPDRARRQCARAATTRSICSTSICPAARAIASPPTTSRARPP